MIRSMTGYGQASAECPGLRVTVELRSLNNRFADIRLKLPAELASREAELRRRVAKRFSRGRVEGLFKLENSNESAATVRIDERLVQALGDAAVRLGKEHGIAGTLDLPTVLRLPGVLEIQTADDTWGDERQATLEATLDRALDALQGEREREGAELREDLLERFARMEGLAESIESRAAELPDLQRQKLLERVEALAQGVELDPARVAQEATFLADRSDVTEEVVRLRGHIAQARSLLAEPDGQPVGKRLDFLLQEIHRETNTVNSKSSDLEMSRHALELKLEGEKVREQVQNLE
jgi:uncharacterized protein (TIGR00255 family)